MYKLPVVDGESIRNLIKYTLKDFEIQEAVNGKDALDKASDG